MNPPAPEVLLVTKPLVPPWTDGSKNLARDLVRHAPDVRFHCLVTPGAPAIAPNAVLEPVYPPAEQRYAPGLAQNARVLARLLKPDNIPIYHFFFAPNPRTSLIAGLVFALKKRRVIHTVVSRPVGAPRYFADTHVAVSRHTADALVAAGARDVHVIPPGIALVPPSPSDRPRFGIPDAARVVLFAGDLVSGGGAQIAVDAALEARDTVLVMACRPKGLHHAKVARELRTRLGSKGIWLGEVSDMPALLASVDGLVMPATDLTGKVDLPLVLLEAMYAGKPVIVADVAPFDELGDASNGVIRVPPRPGALVEAFGALIPALGACAHRRVSDSFSGDRMAAAYHALYAKG